MQNVFFNIEGLEVLLKELKSLHSDEKIREIEETIKSWKSNRNKRGWAAEDQLVLDSILNSNLANELDEVLEYKRALMDCLAAASSQKEDSRKKIIESKEVNIILYSLEDKHNKIILSAANLLLSLSRAHLSCKKFFIEFDIISVLFKLTNHNSIEIQIAITNSLCNFLLDSTNVQ
jgi:hypothetical protein